MASSVILEEYAEELLRKGARGMGSYVIQIDDEKIIEQINNILNTIMNREMQNKYGSTGYEISQAVKNIVYSRKDEIIDKVVERATREIVKKGLPKLLEKVGE